VPGAAKSPWFSSRKQPAIVSDAATPTMASTRRVITVGKEL
jgi:hypothetical protein